MIKGDPAKFAIESSISKAYERRSFMALGYFILHIHGQTYGVKSPEATMLACSFDGVNERFQDRGKHTAAFAIEPAAEEIADAVRHAIYAPDQEERVFLGFPHSEFSDVIYSKKLIFAPDGDQAFDDHSHVIQFDIDDRVRLIAFRSDPETYNHLAGSMADVWLDAAEFYDILREWSRAFELEWRTCPKTTVSGS
jgi:hypothetical protein